VQGVLPPPPPILAITPQTKCPPLQKHFQPPPNIRHNK
jgi:hypothetical protein